jgi:hypothetical protein
MLDSVELIYLAGTLNGLPWPEGAFVVEIGAYKGQTTVFMAKVFELLGKRIPILSIDPFDRAESDTLNPQGVYSDYISNIRGNNLDKLCIPVAAFSEDVAQFISNNIGVLVLDGCHHHKIVKTDLGLYTQKILPNGFLFIDDYGPAYPGVVLAVDEFFTTTPYFAILHKSHFIVAQKKSEL